MTLRELGEIRRKWLDSHFPYCLIEWSSFDYSILSNIIYRKKAGRGNNNSYNDVIIMFDTETSKKCENPTYIDNGQTKYVPVENHVVAWTMSLRCFGRNLVTLYGHKPSELMKCIKKCMDNMEGFETILYCHNLSYDYVFLRQFLFQYFGTPNRQLNTKPHYPILLQWECGLTIKDSLILAQRSLDKWAKDMQVEHQKASGKWDYTLIRNQDKYIFTTDELEYIEHDTLAGVECIEALMKLLNKSLYSLPYTATGIPREEARKLSQDNQWRNHFTKMLLTYDQYIKAEKVYHGGYTHANRHLVGWNIKDVVAYDFSSSYPFVMLSEKYPMEKFMSLGEDRPITDIIENSENYAFMFKLVLVRPRLKNDNIPMPALQFSKCVVSINPVLDNGRILCADYIEIYLTEQDAIVIKQQYSWDKHTCTEIEIATKDYLPRWFTDYIYSLYSDKCTLKNGDKVLYSLKKATLNSCYGMSVQKCIRDLIEEDYKTGEYIHTKEEPEEAYQKYCKKRTSFLPYQWGVWVTAYAFRNLFELGSCAGTWIYSDTDSCYGKDWNTEAVERYNEKCKQKLLSNGYGAVIYEGVEYWLGVAVSEGLKDQYYEYKALGAKRYCGRCKADNEIHTTVAGVPKRGSVTLQSVDDFKKGHIFKGTITGKLTHSYLYAKEIYTDKNGNETADSIDLTPCDYLLDDVNAVDWEKIFYEEVTIQTYEEV